ncbi:putative prolyl 4-hydroxylase 3 [Dichanthelium oligosanthes]|uniref:procollagen-proline 4-dioxygenase n=1 Tax=Dichanthelium oligosanthes TaxID=888268 RepID=A0A1E5WL05_9POAL|nr:putative prolyl 4-hydroxylase 3 [Dichanthelium oligosanthes]
MDGGALVGATRFPAPQLPRESLIIVSLSKEECDHLISLAKPHMKRSVVVDSQTGETNESSARTSSGMFLRREQDKIIRTIEKRIADYTSIPLEHGEGLQVLHYEVGQKFNPHYDYSENGCNTKNGGPRQATLLMYLSDVEEGGETVFPSAIAKSSSSSRFSVKPFAKRGMSVKPKMGDALLFWSMKPDGSLDLKSLHGASPVIKGDKWSATKWLHVHEYKLRSLVMHRFMFADMLADVLGFDFP